MIPGVPLSRDRRAPIGKATRCRCWSPPGRGAAFPPGRLIVFHSGWRSAIGFGHLQNAFSLNHPAPMWAGCRGREERPVTFRRRLANCIDPSSRPNDGRRLGAYLVADGGYNMIGA
jgi:hypothetical protein